MADLDITNESEQQEAPVVEKQVSLDILLDACLGFALSVSCAVFTYIVVLRHQVDFKFDAVYTVYMALATALFLLIGGYYSERLQKEAGQRLLRIVYVSSVVLSVPLCYFQVFAAAIPLAAIGLVATGFIYSEFLNRLPRKSLMTIVDLLIVCVGFFIIAVNNLEGHILMAAHIACCVVALGLTVAFTLKGDCTPEFISDEDCKNRHIPLRGNRRSLFAIGFMFSTMELCFLLDVEVDLQMTWMVLGCVVAVAGVFSLLVKGLDEKNYKNMLLKGMSVCSAVLLLPITFIFGIAELVFLLMFVFVSVLEVIVVVTAVVESARFNMIAPIWLYGREASVFFVGVAVGTALFSVGGMLSEEYPFAMNATICIAVMVLAMLQIKVNYQCYPFESALATEKPDEEILTAQEQAGRYKALWQRKIQTACDRYKLSPREREVLHYLVKGRDTKYIMDTFYISQSTAKTHIYNIYRKFDVHSRQDLLDFIEDIELEPDETE